MSGRKRGDLRTRLGHNVVQSGHRGTRRSKRQRNDSKESCSCPMCDSVIDDDSDALQCDICEQWFCMSCCGIPKDIFKLADRGDLDSFMWSCKYCKNNIPRFTSMEKSLKQIETKTERRLELLETKVSELEIGMTSKITETAEVIKEKIVEEITSDMDEIIDKKIGEIDERRRRELNLMVFNLPESKGDTAEIKKLDDTRLFNLICQGIGAPVPRIRQIIRIGNPSEKIRPVKVLMEDKNTRREILTRCKDIQKLADSKLSKVIISRDLTPLQRDENKKLRKELETRRSRGEKVVIRFGKIVPDKRKFENGDKKKEGTRNLEYSLPGNSSTPNIQRKNPLELNIVSKIKDAKSVSSTNLSGAWGGSDKGVRTRLSEKRDRISRSQESLDDSDYEDRTTFGGLGESFTNLTSQSMQVIGSQGTENIMESQSILNLACGDNNTSRG